MLVEKPVLTKNPDLSLTCSFKARFSSGPPNYTAPPGGTKVIRVPPYEVVVFLKCRGYVANGINFDGFEGEYFVAQTMDVSTAAAIEGTVTLSPPLGYSIQHIGTALILQQERMQNPETTGAFESYEFGDVVP